MFYAHVVVKGVEVLSRFPYKVGIVAFMAFPELLKSDEGFAEKVKVLAEDPFFDLIEVGWVGDGEWSKAKELAGFKEFSLGLQPEILVRGLNPSSVNESERREAESRLRALTRAACERGMVGVALCSGPNVPETDRRKAIDSLVKTMLGLAEEASKCNMPLYLETFDTDVDKKRLVGRLDMASGIVEEVRASYKNTHILWDLSHAPLLGEKPEDLKRYSDLIGHIHIGAAKRVDNRLYDWHPGFHRPGAVNDEKDVARLLGVLHDIKYAGAVSFEVKPEEGQTTMEVVNSSKSVLVRAYQLFLEGLV